MLSKKLKVNLEYTNELIGLPVEVFIGMSGVDAVIGPIVFLAAFAKIGFKWPSTISNYKQMNSTQRNIEFDNIKSLPIGFAFVSISATEICANLYNSNNINSLSQNAIRSLVDAISDKGFFINTLHMVFTNGDSEKFLTTLKKEYNFMRVICVKKEDSLSPIHLASFFADIRR